MPTACRLTLSYAGLLTALWGLLVPPAAGQDRLVQTDAAGRTTETRFPEGALITSALLGDSLIALTAFDPDEEVPLIVQFESPPLSVVRAQDPGAAKAGRIAAAEAVLEQERRQFEADVARLEAAGDDAQAPADLRLRYDYRRTFNGVALTTRRWAAQHLTTLPYVRGVYADVEMHTLDEESNRVIRADRVQEDLGATGRGVVIAVLDSGIDYRHPDLGGGFGAGFKVMGGYDFFDGDDDPMDPFGHGTHVAGIAAADGPANKGVAPDARLLAVRVTGPQGTGLSSTVLAGIEYAVDPDGDPNTDDQADVMNLSLGGPGTPSDPASQALDNAVRSGVVCVVAAGNRLDYRTIQSPGTSARALTVGATDKADNIAYFSSRGPTDLVFTNKPDLVAPGVDIIAPFPGGTYRSLQGTSMAAPHVAGAAALLLELHPDWEPDLVKAALMQSAVDIGQDVWTQGTGRLDVLAAAQRSALATPSTISLGLLDLSQPTLTYTETITLHNLSAQEQTFDLSVEGASTVGLDAGITPERVTVAAGGQGIAVFSAVIHTAQIPFEPILPPPFVGRIVARSAQEALTIPFTFLKTPHLVLQFDDGLPLFLLVHDGVRHVVSRSIDDLTGAASIALPLPEGDYDIVGVFVPADPEPRRFYVAFDLREHVPVTQTTKTLLSWKQGENTILYRLIDVDGNPMEPDFTFAQLVFGAEQVTLNLGGTFLYDHLTVADASDRYALNLVFHTLSHPSGADYVIPFSLGPGLASSVNLSNDPAAFVRSDARFDAGPHVRELAFAQAVYNTVTGSFPRRSFFFSEALRAHHRLTPPFRRTVYYGTNARPGSAYRFQSYQIFDATTEDVPSFPGAASQQLFDSVILEVTPGQVVGRRSLDLTSSLFSTRETTLEEVVGVAPPYWIGRFTNTGPKSTAESGPSINLERAPLAPFFANPGGDLSTGSVDVQLFADGRRITEETRGNEPSFAALRLRNLSTGPAYEMQFTFDGYQVQGVRGQATARLHFRLDEDAAVDANPPVFTSLRLTTDEHLTDVFLPAADNAVRFTLQDVDAAGGPAPVASAELFYHRLGEGPVWEPLPVSRSGDAFTASWPDDVPEGYYGLRILASDPSGHTLDYTAEPALLFGTRRPEDNAPPATFTLLTPEDGALLDTHTASAAVVFTWEPSSDADGDLLWYTLSLSGPGLDTTFTAGAQSAFSSDLLARLREGATYTWTVHASDGFALVPAAEPFTFVTAGTATPVDDAPGAPHTFTLAQNYPNPFHAATTFAFALPDARAVRLEVFDVLGRKVAALVDGVLPAGRHTAVWDARDAPSGTYFYRLTAGDFIQTRHMTLLR